MKVVGLVAEFNPLHKGHKYLLDTIKKECQADYIVVALSGDFVQRGEPACVDKYLRTQMALAAGADLVLEIPTVYATASAEYYAKGAIDTLCGCGVIDELCFGAEYVDFPFVEVAQILTKEPASYQAFLKQELSLGQSYAAARAKALMSYLTDSNQAFGSNRITEEMLNSPNCILGIEYAKAAMAHGLRLHPLQRVGGGYHDLRLCQEYTSASAIRNGLFSELPEQKEAAYAALCSEFIPLIQSYESTKRLLRENDLSLLLYQALLQGKEKGFSHIFDCDEDLSNLMLASIPSYTSYADFIMLLKTKRYTYSRISRVLLHTTLGITKQDLYPISYLRILGFRRASSPLLSEIKAHGAYPMISKMADAKNFLSEEGMALLSKDIYGAELYEQLAYISGQKRNEMTQSPIIIDPLHDK